MHALRVGVSSCLLGNRVRYDGRHKYQLALENGFPDTVELVSFCPEVAIGMGVPRPPIYLSDSLARPEARQVDDPGTCFTGPLREFAACVAEEYELHGFVFKARSPSCGLYSAPVIIDGKQTSETVSGIFAAALLEYLPHLPAVDEASINSVERRDQFLERCHLYRQCISI